MDKTPFTATSLSDTSRVSGISRRKTLLKLFMDLVTGSDLKSEYRRARLILFLAITILLIGLSFGLNVINERAVEKSIHTISDPFFAQNIPRDQFPNYYAHRDESIQKSTIAARDIIIRNQIIVVTVILIGVWIALYYVFRPLSKELQQKTDFANMVSHELKTPLSIIKSKVSLLSMDVDKEVAAELDEITLELNRLHSLAMRLLKNTTETEEVIHLASLIQAIMKRLKVPKQQYEIIGDTDNNLMVDRVLIEQLYFNLLENASKYKLSNTKITIRITDKYTMIANRFDPARKPNSKRGLLYAESMANDLGGVFSETQEGGVFKVYIRRKRLR